MLSVGHELTGLDSLAWVADYPRSVGSALADRDAIVIDGRRVTYAQLDAASDRVGTMLQDRGFRAGARVAYIGLNSDLFYSAFFGAIRAGCVLVPINWRLAPREIALILEDSEAQLVICDEASRGLVSETFGFLSHIPCLMHTEAVGNAGASLREITQAMGSELSRSAWELSRSAWDGSAPIVQMYTSGTTGQPKGVVISHRGLSMARHSEMLSGHWDDWSHDDVLLSAMPNFHVGGLSWMLIGLSRGITCVHTADASPQSLLSLMQKHGVTRTFMVPTVLQAVLGELLRTGMKLPRLRTIFYGASPIGPSLLQDSQGGFGCSFAQFFGMTEASGAVTLLSPKDHDAGRPELLGSIGKPLPGVSIEIRTPAGMPSAMRECGEIWIKSETLMIGYWKRPEANAEVLRDGWYRSGDGGYVDENGYIYLTDRIKDMIKTGGENVYPAEVEAVLRQHPAVRDVAVIGTADPVWGEVVTAVMEWRSGKTASQAEIQTFARSHLAGFKCPKIVRNVENLPRTASGKIQKASLRKLIADLLAAEPGS